MKTVSPPFLFIAGAVIFISAVAGWFVSNTGGADEVIVADNWPAYLAEPQSVSDERILTFLQAVQDSSLIPAQPRAEDQIDLFGGGEGSGPLDPDAIVVPDPPRVLSVSTIDGRARVHLVDDDANIIHLESGEVSPSGWEVAFISMDEVDFTFGEETRSFEVQVASETSDD